MLSCFVLVCNRSRASSTRTRPTSTHIGWSVKENFPETFKSQLKKKIKMLFTSLGRSVLGETVPSVWLPPSAVLGGTQDLGHSFSQYGPPSRWITYIDLPNLIINEEWHLLYILWAFTLSLCYLRKNTPLSNWRLWWKTIPTNAGHWWQIWLE